MLRLVNLNNNRGVPRLARVNDACLRVLARSCGRLEELWLGEQCCSRRRRRRCHYCCIRPVLCGGCLLTRVGAHCAGLWGQVTRMPAAPPDRGNSFVHAAGNRASSLACSATLRATAPSCPDLVCNAAAGNRGGEESILSAEQAGGGHFCEDVTDAGIVAVAKHCTRLRWGICLWGRWELWF